MGKVLRFKLRENILCNFCMKEKQNGLGKPKMMYSLSLGKYNTLCLAQYYSGWWKHVSEEKTIIDGTEITYVEEVCYLCPDCSPHAPA